MIQLRRFGALAALAGLTAACQTGPFADRADVVASLGQCSPRSFDVYFAEAAAGLTQPARQAIDMMADQLSPCRITRVTVIGLASATGTPEANLTLSQRRAQTVAAEFARRGWPEPAFQVEAAGDAGAVTPDGTMEPLRRRTQVLIEAQPL